VKRIIPALVLASCTTLFAGLAFGAANPPTPVKTEIKGTEYHHLLMLDLKEAKEHARALNHYAKLHTTNLDRQVVTRHVDELVKNLDAAQAELGEVGQNVGTYEKAAVDPRLSMIRTEEEKARQDVDALKLEAASDKPNASVIAVRTRAVYEAMEKATEHHRRVMVARGVHEPEEPKAHK